MEMGEPRSESSFIRSRSASGMSLRSSKRSETSSTRCTGGKCRLSARAARRKSLLSPVFKSVNAVSVNASRHALMLMTTCSSAVRASHSSRAFARLTQAFFEDQPSHVRSFPDTAVSPLFCRKDSLIDRRAPRAM